MNSEGGSFAVRVFSFIAYYYCIYSLIDFNGKSIVFICFHMWEISGLWPMGFLRILASNLIRNSLNLGRVPSNRGCQELSHAKRQCKKLSS